MENTKKRRKSKDNPYTLKINQENYIVSFKDGRNIYHEVIVRQEVYDAFDKFELKDISQMHEYERHIEHSEIYEETLYKRSIDKPIGVEENIIQLDELYKLKIAIDMLAETQKRRIKKYFFDNKTLQQIADEEGCNKVSIKNSIDVGIKNLKENLKKLKI